MILYSFRSNIPCAGCTSTSFGRNVIGIVV
nr:MAG TPA: NiFe/NiFeSe hydrogenase small subunit C-terminal [Caudoviricetes sp.]